jgi:hypothetical protein
MPNSRDTNGNVQVDFVWGNVPLQPNDDRGEDTLDPNLDNHEIVYESWNGYPGYNPGATGPEGPTYTTIDSFTWPAFVGPEIYLGIYDSQVFIYPVSGQLTGYQIGDYVTLSGTTHGLDVTKVEIIDVVTAAFGDNTIILSEEEVTPAWLEGITGSPFGGTPYYDLEGATMTIERLS